MGTEMNPTTGLIVDIFRTTLEFLTSPEEAHNAFCTLRCVIPPGITVPLHSHSDTEDFLVLSGEVETLIQNTQGHEWVVGKAGDFFHVPSGTRHAWRNVGSLPLIVFVAATPKLGRFFRDVGIPVMETPHSVTSGEITRHLTIAASYGYWNATTEENAAVGIHL